MQFRQGRVLELWCLWPLLVGVHHAMEGGGIACQCLRSSDTPMGAGDAMMRFRGNML
jgi:hypothetical protein